MGRNFNENNNRKTRACPADGIPADGDAGGLRGKGILGTWEYDEASEYKEPDTKNVVIEIEEDIFRMKRNESGHEMNLDFHYEKDDETLYITDLVQAMADGENVTEKAGFDSGGEMIEIPYKCWIRS